MHHESRRRSPEEARPGTRGNRRIEWIIESCQSVLRSGITERRGIRWIRICSLLLLVAKNNVVEDASSGPNDQLVAKWLPGDAEPRSKVVVRRAAIVKRSVSRRTSPGSIGPA